MVVFLDELDSLIICIPPGDIVMKKFGLAGLEFNCNYSAENSKVNFYGWDPGKDLTTPGGTQTVTQTDQNTGAIITGPVQQTKLIYTGYQESEQKYNFAVSSFLNIRDESGGPYGVTFKDVLDALCVFINYEPSSGGSGEVNTASNVTSGGGIGLFKQKTGVDLEFKSLIAGTNITLTAGANDITIDAAGGGTGDFSVTLDSSLSTVTRTVAAGVTTFAVTHSLNTEDIQAEVYRLSDNETVGWTIVRTSVNVIECSRAGSVADNLFRVVILKSGSSGGGGGGGGIALTDLSVTAEGAAAGDGDLAYNNTNGEFTYSPPLLNGLSATGTTNFGANKIEYANNYATLGDLPSASTYHGMFAHVHAEGAAYYSHAGAWVKLADASAAGGKEGYIDETLVWSCEINGTTGTQMQASGVQVSDVQASPMMFQQDVKLIDVRANLVASTNAATGYVGIYEYVARTTVSGNNWYEYTKLTQITPTFSWVNGQAAQEQILTLSTPYTFLAGKVYVVIVASPLTAGGTGQVYSMRYLAKNSLLNSKPATSSLVLERSLRASSSFSAPYTMPNFQTGILPTTIYFLGEVNNFQARNKVRLNIQNA
jgi:hypothetical protein